MFKRYGTSVFLFGICVIIVLVVCAIAITISIQASSSQYSIGDKELYCTRDPFRKVMMKDGELAIFRCTSPESTLLVFYQKQHNNIDYHNPVKVIRHPDAKNASETLTAQHCTITVDFVSNNKIREDVTIHAPVCT